MSVILDAGTLIVFLQSNCKHGGADAAERHARQRDIMIGYLNGQKSPFIVPAIAYTEFLIGLPDEYKEYLSGLPQKFRVAPLTERVALIASQLKVSLMGAEQVDDIAATYGQSKTIVRADIFVLATCKAEGDKILVTRDRQLCMRAEKLLIRCSHIDDIPGSAPHVPSKNTRSMFDPVG